METTKHTPGPWKINGPIIGPQSIFSPRNERESSGVCALWANIPETKQDMGERIANARLIAAAPDLLMALKGLTEAFEPYVDDERDAEIRERNEAWLSDARAAIARVEKGE